VEAELRQEPAADEGACDSDEEVADDPETGALHDLARQPSGNEADHQYDQQTFTRHVHVLVLQLASASRQTSASSGDATSIVKDRRTQREHSPFQEERPPPLWLVKPHAKAKTVQNCSQGIVK
jgi:hypothetical protein